MPLVTGIERRWPPFGKSDREDQTPRPNTLHRAVHTSVVTQVKLILWGLKYHSASPRKKKQQNFGEKRYFWGQSYKDFYTLGQIFKRTLKHVNNSMRQTFVCHNVRTLHPNIIKGLHFYSGLKRQFRHFILHQPNVKSFIGLGPDVTRMMRF